MRQAGGEGYFGVGLGRHTDGRNGCDDFTELELVENGSLSGSVQANHQNSHLLLSPQTVKQL